MPRPQRLRGSGLGGALLWFALAGTGLVASAPWTGQAFAQEVDADYRLHDTVYLTGTDDPLRGTILAGADPGAAKLKIRLVNDIVTEIDRSRVSRIVPRETPASAFKSRAAAIANSGDASLHGRLARWVLGHGLTLEAEAEFALAAKTASDPQEALPYRVQLVNLLEARLAELGDDDPTLPTLQEAILAQARAPGGEGEPALLVARARVLVELGMPERSLAPLSKARGILEIKASSAPASGEGGEGAEEGGGEGGGQGAEESPQDTPAPPRRPVRRFGRDGERIPPPRKPVQGPRKAAPEPPSDNSAQLLPGLSANERELYRVTLGDLAQVALMNDAPETAQKANARILEIWPEDRDSLLSQARLANWAGDAPAVLKAFDGALRVHVEDPELLLARGQLRYLSGRLGEAQADLERATRAAGTEGDLARAAHTALALVHLAAGRTQPATPLLEVADQDPGYGPARLAKALLSELSNDPSTAAVHAEEAARLLQGGRPDGAGEAHYLRAYALQKGGKIEEAGRALIEALRQGYEFQLVSRARIELAKAKGDDAEEARLVELLVRSSAAPTAEQLAALGRVYIRQGRISDGERVFKQGLAQTPTHRGCLQGLAYCAYTKDDRLKAHAYFKQLLEQDPKDTWSKRGLKQLEQVNVRRVWTDEFQRPDGEVLNAWSIESPYGVGVSLRQGAMRFTGQQANDPRGKTLVTRVIENETVVKFEATLRVSATNQGRLGIRLEVRDKKVVLFRSPQDGRLYASTVFGNRPWTDPVDLGPFGSGAHTLAIDVEDVGQGRVAFLKDGVRLGEVKLNSIAGRRRTTLGIYGQATQLNETIEFSVDQVWVYVERTARTPKRRGLKQRDRKEDGGGY